MWKPSRSKTLAGYKCVKHSSNVSLPGEPVEYELTLSGKYGDVWQVGEARYRAIITSPRVAKLLGLSPIKKGDECLLSFTEDRMAEIVKLLKIPRSAVIQARRANAYGKES